MGDLYPNPLSGQPDVVRTEGELMVDASEAMVEAARALRQLRSDLFRSQAIDAISDAAHESAGAVSRAHGRYSDAGSALRDYGHTLAELQTRSFEVSRNAQQLGDMRARLMQQAEAAYQAALLPGPEQMGAIDQLNRTRAEIAEIDQRMQAFFFEWTELANAKNQAAAQARDRIRRGNERSDLDDSFWDDLGGFLGDIIDVINIINKIVQVILKIVSVILTVLAVVFVVLGAIFPPLAGIGVALFGYARLVDLVIAALVLLQVLMEGLNLLDLLVAVTAVAASLLGGALGSLAGSFAKGLTAGLAAAGTMGQLAGKAIEFALSQGIEAATDAAVDAILDLSPGAADIYDAIDGVAGDFFDSFVDDAIGDLGGLFESAGQAAGEGFGGAIDGIGDAIGGGEGGVFDSIGGAFEGIGDAIGGAVGGAADSLGITDAAGDAYSTVTGTLDDILDAGGRSVLEGFGIEGASDMTGADLIDKLLEHGRDAVVDELGGGLMGDAVGIADDIILQESGRLIDAAKDAAFERSPSLSLAGGGGR